MTKLERIKSLLSQVLEQFSKISTNKGLLQFDGDELEVGIAVYIVDEEGNESKPEDGDYETDTQVIKIEDGKVTEINDIEKVDEPGEPQEEIEASAEEPAEEEEVKCPARERFNKIQALFEESYEDKTFKIAAAIRALGVDSWVVECGDDFAIVEVWDEETASWGKHWRYDITWDAEGNATASNPVEVVEEYVPVGENREETIAELRKEIETLKAEPQAKPAADEFRQATAPTGNKTMDKIANLFSK